MLKVRDLVTVFVLDCPTESVTPLVQSSLTVPVTVAVGPINMKPAVTDSDTPEVSEKLTECSLDTELEAETDITGDISQD